MATHIDENCEGLTGHFKGDVFYNCKFRKLNGLTLEGCDLNHSQFTTEDVREALGFTVTLNCLSFNNVTLSELCFDLILMLLCKSKGNDEKRKKLLEVLGPARVVELLRQMKNLE